ncbi:tail completion protein R (GpR) [Sphingomonas sp. PP-F2F-G114-C0414]|uniref:phage tail protein n=1 Tax=Sphingomonas sp. PP-F2F-G114-C0414 TaxID=2135662 RepID=UPI000F24DCD8|nr:phage tail protein [Sphingomonas sp. PP-F2F-G114-C0414]RMB26251.1 tail completion protein R (GpR) [Sphingomonas sp. PP-F2F-G114-C0414]
MKKLDSLRTHLLASVPEIRNSPEKMEIFVDKGDVAVRAGSLSFEYSYTASLWVQDFSASVDKLLVPVLAWIAANQPDLFEKGDRKPFTFQSDLLDAETCDITISINLTELVRVEQQAKGLKVTHLPEPVMLDQFDGVPTGTKLWAGLIEDVAGTIETVTR